MKFYYYYVFIFLYYVSATKVDYCTKENCQISKDYCIIGAGPSGLQMGYFLEKSERDYLIFEKTDKSGSLFEKYPRHRKLLSINKRHTGQSNKEFNLRHDWNSLISDNENLLFTKYSKDYFPHADDLVSYIADFQQKLNIKVQFNTEISNLTFHEKEPYGFSMKDQENNEYACKSVFIATGLSVPVNFISPIVENYETVSVNPDDFEGEAVLILGNGNSGLEVATSIYGHASFVHIFGRNRVRLSWETHYVGDLRGVNNELLDSYMLKSLDAMAEGTITGIQFSRGKNGKIYFDDGSSPSMDQIKSEEDSSERNRSNELKDDVQIKPELNWLFSDDNFPTRTAYDRVIGCLGFTWDKTLYNNSTLPEGSEISFKQWQRHLSSKVQSKFPDISYDYESTQFPGMYFIGPLGHSLDFRKSAGGFIHGFRYTARALHNLLEWKNHGIPWPSVSNDISELLPSLLKRANEGSGIYQMFENLGDVAIVDKYRVEKTFTYLEEYPINLLAELVDKTGHQFDPERHSVVVMVLEYGKNWSKPGKDHFREDRANLDLHAAHKSNFLHPVFYFYHKLPSVNDMGIREMHETLPKPDGIHHIVEDFGTKFDAPRGHMQPLRNFLEFFLDIDLRSFKESNCMFQKLASHPVDISGYCRSIA